MGSKIQLFSDNFVKKEMDLHQQYSPENFDQFCSLIQLRYREMYAILNSTNEDETRVQKFSSKKRKKDKKGKGKGKRGIWRGFFVRTPQTLFHFFLLFGLKGGWRVCKEQPQALAEQSKLHFANITTIFVNKKIRFFLWDYIASLSAWSFFFLSRYLS